MIPVKKYQLIWLFSILFITYSCLNSDDCVEETYSSPRAFDLKIVDEAGTNLITEDIYHPDSISLYYNDNLGRTVIKIYFEEISDGYIITSSKLPRTMLETNNTIYFLYLNLSDTDTLNIELVQESDGCSTWYRYVDCMYNGNIMDIDPESYAYLGVK